MCPTRHSSLYFRYFFVLCIRICCNLKFLRLYDPIRVDLTKVGNDNTLVRRKRWPHASPVQQANSLPQAGLGNRGGVIPVLPEPLRSPRRGHLRHRMNKLAITDNRLQCRTLGHCCSGLEYDVQFQSFVREKDFLLPQPLLSVSYG